MREVWRTTQCIDYQNIEPFELLHRSIGQCKRVGYIGCIAYAKAQNGQFIVHDPQRHYLYIAYTERSVGLNGQHLEARHSGIGMLIETVGYAGLYITYYWRLGIYRERLLYALGPQIVQPATMVVVAVRHKKGIDPCDVRAQCLITEIGPAIYQYIAMACRYQNRCPESLIASIGTGTHLT